MKGTVSMDAVLGLVIIFILVGELAFGANSFLYKLANPNTSVSAVTVFAGTILPILFFYGLVKKVQGPETKGKKK